MQELDVIEIETSVTPGEREFQIKESYEDGRTLRVHPWHRGNPGVYVSIQEPDEADIPDEALLKNIIVDRAKFVEGLLATFDELQLKEEK